MLLLVVTLLLINAVASPDAVVAAMSVAVVTAVVTAVVS